MLYGLVTLIRNKFFDWGWMKELEFEVPLINVGNLAVGGTGKTPHIAYLIDRLQGPKVAVLSRGYGRRTKGYNLVSMDSKVDEVGDEILMLKMRFPSVPMAVHENRALGIAELLAEHPDVDLILLDDAFQHRHVKPKVNILLTEYQLPFFLDWLMPAGRLREFRSGYKRADIAIFTKCPEDAKTYNTQRHLPATDPNSIFYSRMTYPKLQRVTGRDGTIAKPILVTSIAKPEYLKNHLQHMWPDIVHSNYRDHHKFTQKELDQLAETSKHVICTEKDWVKLQELNIPASLNIWIQAIEIEISGDGLIHKVQELLSQ